MMQFIAYFQSITWLFPWAFVLLIFPWLVYFNTKNKQASQGVQFAIVNQYLEKKSHDNHSKRHVSLDTSVILMYLSWCFMIMAIAQPVSEDAYKSIKKTGRDLMLAIDASESMREQDMQLGNYRVDRYTALKKIMGDFIQTRKGDNIGLILFGSNAFTLTPLSYDIKSVESMLIDSTIGIAGPKTAIGDAIGLAIKRLNENESDKVLILVTDGTNTSGRVQPLDAARKAAEIGMKIYTVGMGAESHGIFGRQSSIDEKTLTEIANMTNGKYYRARNTQELSQFIEDINAVEAIEQEDIQRKIFKPLYQWPLSIALVLFFISSFWGLMPFRQSSKQG